MKYFVDHTYGDVYENRTKYGAETWGTTKGGGGKAGYHSIELGYLTYVYNKLYLKKEPAKLFYKFKSQSEERVVKLTPLEFGLEDLVIKSVVLNDAVYTAFNSSEREITIPANTDALCEVIFSSETETAIEFADNEIPAEFELKQNYPNPFNPATVIEYTIPAGNGYASLVQLKIFDILGNEVSTLVNELKAAGNYKVKFEGNNLSSGVYFYQLKAGSFNQVKRMMFLK
ncbi:MAG: T9SS type A sorting domain-containing protein [Melioribacteraceae bacterium]|nr:T9SS type A sorting domain-containing protein [Melioribacteraceae bacterium]